MLLAPDPYRVKEKPPASRVDAYYRAGCGQARLKYIIDMDNKKPVLWGDKRYHSFNHHLRETFGTKVFKISLDAGFTCPNRDGTKGTGGCAFCSPAGSGDFAGNRELSIPEQFHQVKAMMHKKWPQAKYIAYFQAFTNTYAPAPVLRELYESALTEEGGVGLSIATRPDCLAAEVLDMLEEFNRRTYLWLELGLQTRHESMAQAMNLGYVWDDFVTALNQLRRRNIKD